MKKSLIAALLTLIIAGQSTGVAFASNANMKNAVAKYKKGNYVGCLQDTKEILKKDPDNAMAQYYSAISYVQIGDSAKAQEAYNSVIKLSPNSTLTSYSKKGLACLSNKESEECRPKAQAIADIETFINSKHQISPEVQRQIKESELNRARYQINKEVGSPTLGAPQQMQPPAEMPAVNKKSELPSDAEIGAAVRTLAAAGINVLPSQTGVQPMPYQANSEMAQLNMLFANNNQNGQNYNNNMMSIMPYLLTQNQSGQQNVSPEILKTMMMTSLMDSFSFDTTKKDY